MVKTRRKRLMHPPDGYLSAAEFARAKGIKDSSITTMLQLGTLKVPYIKRGGHYFVSQEALAS